jgi:hypothetical protein
VASAIAAAPSSSLGPGPVSSAASRASVAAPPQSFEVRVTGAPSGAVVLSEGRELGPASDPLSVRAGAPTTLVVTAKGYKPRELTVAPTANTVLPVALERQPAPVVKAAGGAQGKISSDLDSFEPSGK